MAKLRKIDVWSQSFLSVLPDFTEVLVLVDPTELWNPWQVLLHPQQGVSELLKLIVSQVQSSGLLGLWKAYFSHLEFGTEKTRRHTFTYLRGCGPVHNTPKESIWKRRFYFENASNVFRAHCAAGI